MRWPQAEKFWRICAHSAEVGWKVASCTGDDFYERSDDGGLRRYVFHIEQCNRNASIQPRWRDLQCVAVGDHLRCDLGRGALLHNGRDNADYILCSMRSTDDCLQDRVSPGDCCRARQDCKRGCLGRIHNRLECRGYAVVLSRGRHIYFCADGDHSRYDHWREHLLLRHRGLHSHSVIDALHRADHGFE